MRQPRIPMRPQDKPMQHLFDVVDFPAVGTTPRVERIEGMTSLPGLPKQMGRSAIYLCQLEWAWTPMHNRISAFYLHRARKHWILYDKIFVDNEWRWITQPVARCVHGDLSVREAGLIMMARILWDDPAERSGPGPWHWINELGFLTVGDLKALARELWPREIRHDGETPVRVLR